MRKEYWLITYHEDKENGGKLETLMTNMFEGGSLGEIASEQRLVIRFAVRTNRKSWKDYTTGLRGE